MIVCVTCCHYDDVCRWIYWDITWSQIDPARYLSKRLGENGWIWVKNGWIWVGKRLDLGWKTAGFDFCTGNDPDVILAEGLDELAVPWLWRNINNNDNNTTAILVSPILECNSVIECCPELLLLVGECLDGWCVNRLKIIIAIRLNYYKIHHFSIQNHRFSGF